MMSSVSTLQVHSWLLSNIFLLHSSKNEPNFTVGITKRNFGNLTQTNEWPCITPLILTISKADNVFWITLSYI